MKHIMCVRFQRWSVDLARRKSRRHEPLVLVQSTASRQTVVAACEGAMSAGVLVGMTLAEARAMTPGLISCDYTPEQDSHSLLAMARWMIRFSPVVAVEHPDAIFLDLTGSQRLFGGYDRLVNLVSEAVSRWRFAFRIAVAPTPGAAWALASFGDSSGVIVAAVDLPEALEPLPVAALRLDLEITAALRTLGIRTVKQLRQLPRKSLPSRFGSAVLMRIDQAFGFITEPLVGVQSPEQIRADLECESGIESLEMLWEAFKRLISTVTCALGEQGRGARRLVLELTAADTAPVQKEIQLSKASCNVSVIFNLLRCAGETIKSSKGFQSLSLRVLESERLTQEQLDFLEDDTRNAEADFRHLMERLRARLGSGVVFFPGLAASHLPERAFSLAETSDPKNSPSPDSHRFKPRPFFLLPEPAEIRCMVSPSATGEGTPLAFVHEGASFHLMHASGPERISGIWWEGRGKTREYFDVEERGGRRFWIFRVRENKRWFLHGLFDG